MLKTIAKAEFEKLRDTLMNYHEHLLENPHSLLTRYYGLHKIRYLHKGKTREQYIIIMNNMFRHFNPDIKYDLKGSTLGRNTELKDGKRDTKIALKDNDFIEDERDVNLYDEDKKELLSIVKKDADYLGVNSTLDYSLLLGIIDLTKVKKDYEDDPTSFHEQDPVLQVLKEGNEKIKDRGIYVSPDKKEVRVSE